MKIGMIGAGEIAQGVAKYALAQGHEVLLTSRTPDRLASIIAALGPGAKSVSRTEAASAEIVLFSVPWESIEDALAGLPPWNGRILIDTTNPFLHPPKLLVMPELGGLCSSEIVAGLAPGARLIKAFNTMFSENLHEGPRRGDARRVLFVSGDDEAAKATVRELIESFGFATIDLGNLAVGGRMQQAKTSPLAGPDFLLPD